MQNSTGNTNAERYQCGLKPYNKSCPNASDDYEYCHNPGTCSYKYDLVEKKYDNGWAQPKNNEEPVKEYKREPRWYEKYYK